MNGIICLKELPLSNTNIMLRILRRSLTHICVLLVGLTPTVTAFAFKSYNVVPGKSNSSISVLPSGAGHYSLPIVVPIGTNGVSPSLSLNYSSSSGNGLLGRGWSISGMGAVSRCHARQSLDNVSNGVNFDSSDKFCLNGNRLVLVSGGYGEAGSEYRLEVNSNQKIVAHGTQAGSPLYFVVHQPDGRKHIYGGTPDSRVELQGQPVIQSWALSKVSDNRTNYIEFKYQENNDLGETYPTEIRYTGNESQGLSPYNRVEFFYGGREDPIHGCVNGALVQTSRRLQEVRVIKHVPSSRAGDIGDEQVFRRYLLEYNQGTVEELKSVDSSICNEDEQTQSETISLYRELLDTQFLGDVERLERMESVDNISAFSREDLTPPGSRITDFSQLLDAVSSDDDESFDPLELLLQSVEADLQTSRVEVESRFDAMSDSEKAAHLESLIAQETALASAIQSTGTKTKAQLEAEINSLWVTESLARDSVIEKLKKEIKENEEIILFGYSKEKREAYERLKQNVHVKRKASYLVSSECAVLVDRWEENDVENITTCRADTQLEAFEKFQKFKNGAVVYDDLLAQFEVLETQVGHSLSNVLHHPLVAGQIVRSYERFGNQLLAEYGVQWAEDIARDSEPLYEELDRLVADEVAGSLNLDQDYSGDSGLALEHSELESIRFEIGLLTATDREAYFQNYVAGLKDEITVLLTDVDLRDKKLREYYEVRLDVLGLDDEGITGRFNIIGRELRDEATQDYVALQNQLYYGSVSTIAASRLGKADSILPESRITSVMECGNGASCYNPISFKWSSESIGWSPDSTLESLPDSLFSYDQAVATESGTVVTHDGTTSDGADGSAQAATISLTDEEIELGRALAKAGHLVDVNNDGKKDWVLAYVDENGLEFRGTWLNTEAGWQLSPEWELPAIANNFNEVPYGIFVDANSDGLVDWIGSIDLLDGTQVRQTYLNNGTSWELSTSFAFPVAMYRETADGYVSEGEHRIQQGDGARFFWHGSSSVSQPGKFVRFRHGVDHFQIFDRDYPYVTSSLNGASPGTYQPLSGTPDVKSAYNWINFNRSGTEVIVEPYESVGGVLGIYSEYSIQAANADLGEFVDLNGDGLLDWVLSVESEYGSLNQKTLINTGSGWQEDLANLVPPLFDIEGNKIGHLIDLDSDGELDWVTAVKDSDGQIVISTKSKVSGDWVESTMDQLPFEIAEFDSSGEFVDLGRFAEFTGDLSTDWLDEKEVWLASGDDSLERASLILSGGQWQASEEYRLPVLEAGWLSKVGDELARFLAGETVEAIAGTDRNLIDNLLQNVGGESSPNPETDPGQATQIAAQIGGAGNGSMQSSHLVDVDGDGRLDWVKSIKFSESAEQRVVWLRTESGWEVSDTFTPPVALIDFTRSSSNTMVDLNSDGLIDFLSSYTVGSVTVNDFYLNNGSTWERQASFDMPVSLASIDSNGVSRLNAILIDVNNDGLLDLVENTATPQTWLNSVNGWPSSPSLDFKLPTPLTSNASGTQLALGQFSDVNGDGFKDWLEYRDEGDRLWLYAGNGWEESGTILPVSFQADNGDIKALFADLNADGLKDIVLSYKYEEGVAAPDRDAWLNTGDGWKNSPLHVLPSDIYHSGKGQAAQLVDLNGDGLLDFVQHADDGVVLYKHLLLGTGKGWDDGSSIPLPALLAKSEDGGVFKQVYSLVDVDGDLEQDFVRSSGDLSDNPIYFGLPSVDGVIESVYNGIARDEFIYEKGYKPSTVAQSAIRASYPLVSTHGPGVVVAGVQSYLSSNIERTAEDSLLNDLSYTYIGAATNLVRRASVGFLSTQSENWIQEKVTNTRYRQDFPFAGRASKIESSKLYDHKLSVVDFDYDDISTASQRFSTPFLRQSISTGYKESGEVLNVVTETYTPDDQNLGLTQSRVQTVEEGGKTYSTTVVYGLKVDAANWILGLPESETTTKKIGSDDSTLKTLVTSRSFYTGTNLLKTETVAGFTKRYTYDPFGNVHESILGEGSGESTRTVSATFDVKGRFRIGTKDELEGETEFQFSSFADSPTEITVNSGSSTQYHYDGFGRKSTEWSDVDTRTLFSTQFCDASSVNQELAAGCPSGAKYLFAQLTEAARAPEVVYYDALGRELRRTTSSARGVVQIDTEYNYLGKPARRSLPYNPEKNETVQWATFKYDGLGRTTHLVKPGNALRKWVYDGRATTVVDELGYSKTTINTFFGSPELIRDDYGNETRYIYDSFGQLIKTIDATGNNEITIQYDARGNKREVNDPDHGRTTFGHNIFGQVTYKEDQLGNSETYMYDAYGRLKTRTDAGPDADGDSVTTWTYYELDEAEAAYEALLSDLRERGLSDEAIAERNLSKPNHLNPGAKSKLVKEVKMTQSGQGDYIAKTMYDYLARAVSSTVTLPNGESRTLETEYVSETSLPWRMRYPNNFSVLYNYDDNGFLTSVTNGGLNTLDHYLALNERATFLKDAVAPEIVKRAERIEAGSLAGYWKEYNRRNKDARGFQTIAIDHQNRANSLLNHVLDESNAISFLVSELTKITSQSDRDQRDAVVLGLWEDYKNNGHINASSSCSPGAPRYYDLVVPAYRFPDDSSSDPQSPSNSSVSVASERDRFGEHTQQHKTSASSTVAQQEGSEQQVINSPRKTITIELPTVCSPAVSTTEGDVNAAHPRVRRLRSGERLEEIEVQVRTHILGMMEQVRNRRNLNESSLNTASVKAKENFDKAIEKNNSADNYYLNYVKPLQTRVNGLYNARNEVIGKINDIYRKSQRVYQFYEVEQTIEFWSAGESDETNRVLSETYGNGVTTTRTYNPITGSLSTIEALTDENVVVQDEVYRYDAAGNLRIKSDRHLGFVSQFEYDRLHRVNGASYDFLTNSTQVIQTFAYDAIGNITSKSDVGTYSYDLNHPHAVKTAGGRTYAYDAVGRMKTADNSTFSYTSYSKPKRITDGNDFVEYAYGPDRGRYYQKSKVGDAVTENFSFFAGLYEESKVGSEVSQKTSISVAGKTIASLDGHGQLFALPSEVPDLGDAADLTQEIENNIRANSDAPPLRHVFTAFDSILNAVDLIADVDSDDEVLPVDSENCELTEEQEAEAGDNPIIECLSDDQQDEVREVYAASLIDIQYLHYDHLDSVKVITGSDGGVLSISLFDAFGNPIIQPEEGEEGAGFGGHEAVAGMDLIHMGGRIYDPVIGRFVSADPFVPAIFEPQALNRYAYVYNNPLKYTDPTGYKPVTATQHERNEYIFVALSLFFLEISLPSNTHLYDLLELSRNDPNTFSEHITAWGASPEAWQRALPFIESAKNTHDTVQEIRKAEREAKYLTIAAVVVTVLTAGAGSGAIAVLENTFLASWWAAPALTTASQYAITGEIDAESVALSFATAYVGSAGTGGDSPLFGAGDTAIIQVSASSVDNAYLVTNAVLRGIGSELAGGEFLHGFGAGLASGLLDRHLPFGDSTNFTVSIIRNGVIEGIVVEIAHETRNGERLDFFDGFQRGGLQELASRLISSNLSKASQEKFCKQSQCFGTVGNLLNLIIEDAGANELLRAFGNVVASFISYQNNFQKWFDSLPPDEQSNLNAIDYLQAYSEGFKSENGVEGFGLGDVSSVSSAVDAEIRAFLDDGNSFDTATPQQIEELVSAVNSGLSGTRTALLNDDKGIRFVRTLEVDTSNTTEQEFLSAMVREFTMSRAMVSTDDSAIGRVPIEGILVSKEDSRISWIIEGSDIPSTEDSGFAITDNDQVTERFVEPGYIITINVSGKNVGTIRTGLWDSDFTNSEVFLDDDAVGDLDLATLRRLVPGGGAPSVAEINEALSGVVEDFTVGWSQERFLDYTIERETLIGKIQRLENGPRYRGVQSEIAAARGQLADLQRSLECSSTCGLDEITPLFDILTLASGKTIKEAGLLAVSVARNTISRRVVSRGVEVNLLNNRTVDDIRLASEYLEGMGIKDIAHHAAIIKSGFRVPKDLPDNLTVQHLGKLTDDALDPSYIRGAIGNVAFRGNKDRPSVAVSKVTIDGETQHFISVSGSFHGHWRKNQVTLENGITYNIVRGNSSPALTVGGVNRNHAEINLMQHFQNIYGGRTTRVDIDISVQNTSLPYPGRCHNCMISTPEFAEGNKNFVIKFFEGTTGTTGGI